MVADSNKIAALLIQLPSRSRFLALCEWFNSSYDSATLINVRLRRIWFAKPTN